MDTEESVKLKVKNFLSLPTYGTNSKFSQQWKLSCFSLGEKAPQFLIQSLEEGSRLEAEQDNAVICLRMLGYGAEYSEDEKGRRLYEVRTPGSSDWRIIFPSTQPYNINDPEFTEAVFSGTLHEYERAIQKKESEEC
jgi:hypothetical protein